MYEIILILKIVFQAQFNFITGFCNQFIQENFILDSCHMFIISLIVFVDTSWLSLIDDITIEDNSKQ